MLQLATQDVHERMHRHPALFRLAACTSGRDGVHATDRLGEEFPAAKAYAGVASRLVAVSVSREPRNFVLWFWPEVVRTVRWGGDPNKPVEVGPNGIRLTPRKSFDAWAETVSGRSSPWSPSENDAAFDLRVSLLEIVLRRIDAAARERLRAWEQEQLLMAELDHRVRNTLANIQAIVSQSSRNATSLADSSKDSTGASGRWREHKACSRKAGGKA